jgi:hypothetical protein
MSAGVLGGRWMGALVEKGVKGQLGERERVTRARGVGGEGCEEG